MKIYQVVVSHPMEVYVLYKTMGKIELSSLVFIQATAFSMLNCSVQALAMNVYKSTFWEIVYSFKNSISGFLGFF